MRRAFHNGDYVKIGQPPEVDVFKIVAEPEGHYAKVVRIPNMPDDKIHTVYMGRWFEKVDTFKPQ